ncbi:MAG: trigger factor [Planctomycetota bacterium]|nr:MAG: trigger factor [Planctomycetota bacterium]
MDVRVEEVGPCRKRLSVTVPAETVKKHVDAAYKAANQQVRLKGFRPGRIPRKVLQKQMGDAILAHAKEDLVSESFREAIGSQKLDIVGSPRLDISEDSISETEALSYTVDCDLRPEVTVGDIKSIALERNSSEPTDEEMQGALDQLALSKRKLETVADAELEDGDFAKVDMRYELDGEIILEKSGMQLSTRIPIAGTDAELFATKLRGLKSGDETEIELSYPEAFEKEEARGKEGKVHVKLSEIQRFVSPEIDDEFAKGFEMESADELREKLRERIREEKTRNEDFRLEEEILNQLFSQNEFPLPEGLVEEEANNRLKRYAEELEQQKASKEEIEKRVAEAREEATETSRLVVRNLFLVQAIASKEKLFVTEDDVRKELQRIASENNAELSAVQEHFEKENLFGELRFELSNRKVREFLKDKASITEAKPEEDES